MEQTRPVGSTVPSTRSTIRRSNATRAVVAARVIPLPFRWIYERHPEVPPCYVRATSSAMRSPTSEVL